MAPIYIGAEELSRKTNSHGQKSLREIMEDLRNVNVLQTAIDGDNPVDRSKNVVTNANDIMVQHAAEYSISESGLEARMYEMFDTCCKKSFSSHIVVLIH